MFEKERPIRNCKHFFRPLSSLNFGYKRRKLTFKSLQLQVLKNFAEGGTLKFNETNSYLSNWPLAVWPFAAPHNYDTSGLHFFDQITNH